MENQRIRLTKRLLQESLLALMEKKAITEISISELCEKAGINRSTFYKHYGSQYDVIKEMENEMIEEISDLMSGSTDITKCNIQRHCEKLCDFLRQNEKKAKFIIYNSNESRLLFFTKIFSLPQIHWFYDSLLKFGYDEESANLIYSFLTMGCSALLERWLFSGKKTPKEVSILISNMFKNLPDKVNFNLK